MLSIFVDILGHAVIREKADLLCKSMQKTIPVPVLPEFRGYFYFQSRDVCMCFHAVIPYFQEQLLVWRNFSLKKKVKEPPTCVQDLLCHKGTLGFCENREIKSTYLLQREATMGDI